MRHRGFYRKLTGLLGVIVIAAGCSGSTATPGPSGTTATPGPTNSVGTPGASGGSGAVVPLNGTTITWATISGFYTDIATSLAADYTAKTGTKVNIVQIDLQSMYDKETLDMAGATGAYDIVTWNLSWLGQWAGANWLAPLTDYVAKNKDVLKLDDISPALMQTDSWQGVQYGLPYYTFTQGMFYRCDLFENATEKANFQAKYGYALDIPTTYQQMADQAQFFRRKPGDTLAGKPVTKDFYGIGLMDGRVNNIFDEANMVAWPMGADVINDDGTPGVTSQKYEDSLNLLYKKMLPYAPAGSLSGGYDFVASQFNTGLIAETGPFYLDQWANMVKVETQVPGAEACVAPHPGTGETWSGTFSMGVEASSKHVTQAEDFLGYLTSPEAQMKFALAGGSTPRTSILTNRALVDQHRDTMGAFPTLAFILNDAQNRWYTNFIWVPQAAKIYNDAPQYFSAAASGQESIADAMAAFAKDIVSYCGGKCTIDNQGITKPDPNAKEPTFDRSLQVRKP
jgi:multiple sugar transport system substrate-binding protein